MSREEAAGIYLDVLMGFRNNYGLYRKAAHILSDKDRKILTAAVQARLKAAQPEEGLF